MSETAAGSGTSTVDAGANGTVATQPEAPAVLKVGDKTFTAEQVVRLQQQVAGANRFAKVLKVMADQKLDPDTVAASLEGSIGTDAEDDAVAGSIDAKKLEEIVDRKVNTILSARDQQAAQVQTVAQHDRTIDAQVAAIGDQVRAALKNASPEAIELAIAAAEKEYDQTLMRVENRYPEDHPLHKSRYAPLDKAKLDTIAANAAGKINKIRGGVIATLGRQAATISTPAGAPAGSGTAQPKGPRTQADIAAGIAQQAAEIAARKRGSGL